jgi:hypothetical protein
MTTGEKSPPRAAEIAVGGHFVQFYENDAFLVDSVSAYIAASLGAREGAIVIATPEHREALNQSLRKSGIEVAGAIARRQYICLDARETLAHFMIDGLPDEDRFRKTVEKTVSDSVSSWKRLRAFGEMVALLWADGNREGAVRLEKLWNKIGESQPFTLFCAYPMHGFRGDGNSGHFEDVCHEHSHVLREPIKR